MRFLSASMTVGLTAAGLALATSAYAGSATGTPDGYVRTGKTENCLRVTDIRSSKILNKSQILFELSGGRAYLNEPTSCPGLSRNYALNYEVTNNDLCTTTIVHIIDPSSPVPNHGACGLDKFQELSKKTAEAK